MKKLLLCFLSLILIFTIVPTCAVNAQSTPEITIANVNAKQGDIIGVPISISNNPGILAMAFCVSYDVEALEYVGYDVGYLTNYNIMNHIDKGYISFVSVEETEVNTNGIMLTLNFKIKDETPNGQYEIAILNNNPDKYGNSLHNSFSNASEQFVVPNVTNGYIVVRDFIKGDVNGDGKVNGRDYSALLQYLNDWDVEIDKDAADVNGDGKLNGKDYSLLMQYLNDWDVEFK